MPYKITEKDFGLVIVLPGDILFDFDKDWLHYEAEEAVGKTMKYINSLPPIYKQIRIEGHTDYREKTPGHNMDLSRRRAQTVLSYFQRNKSHFNQEFVYDPAVGLGATQPVAPNKKPDGSDDADGMQKNRRVEIYLYKK